MKLFFDARYIRTDYHDGISRYGCELGNAIRSDIDIVFIIHDNEQLKLLPGNAKYIKIHKPTSIKEVFTSLILNKYKPDVVFTPMQTMGSIGRRFKLVLTLHDMIYYRNPTPPKQFNPILRASWRAFHKSYMPQRLILNNADTIVTVSNTSKNDILSAKLTRRPITVIPNAPRSLKDLIDGSVISRDNPRNLVYMGSFMPYKNVETLIIAMQYLPGYTLHLLSRITDKQRQTLEKIVPKNSKVIFHKGVSDEQYAKILSDEAILVTASRDEGYGLPVAEALQFGVPAVISDIPIFHEVAGDGALYFDKTNPKDFANKVKQLQDNKLRSEVVKNGTKHIAKFNWKKSADKLIELSKKLHEN